MASQALFLILAVTVLTCSSLFGFYFLKLFAALAFSQATRPDGTPRKAGIFLFLALLSFGLSFGSAKFLSYLNSHA